MKINDSKETAEIQLYRSCSTSSWHYKDMELDEQTQDKYVYSLLL